MDMRFYWIKDHVAQGQYVVNWRKGSNNQAEISPNSLPRLNIASCACGIWSTYTDQLPYKGVLNLPCYHYWDALRSHYKQAVLPSSHLNQRSYTTTKTTTIYQCVLQQLSVVFPLLTHKLCSSSLGLT